MSGCRQYLFRSSRALVTASLIALAGCRTLTATQTDCLADNRQPFPTQAACIRQNVAGNSALRNDTLVQEYVLTADHLAAQVRAGKMTDADARLHLTEKLNDVRERDIAEQAELSEIFSNHGPNGPAYTDCGRTPGLPSCLTF